MPMALANKIAAGEVVQRPASVVKELIENALDAGASTVHVVVRKAGSELIQVTDDGCGMNPDDAERCFQRHATSKIRTARDLERIHTLGFRGEALASVSSVAQVELKTARRGDDAGTRVRIDGGDEPIVEPAAPMAGTSVAVRNLFYNVPARRSFLKSPQTELGHILDTVQVMALANPGVAFRVEHDGHELLDVPVAGQRGLEAVARRTEQMFSFGAADGFTRVEEKTSYLAVRGLLGSPDEVRKTRGYQYLFVNGRHVSHRYLEHAVLSAYEYLVPDGTYPFFALFLDIDPRHVDVNVHPQKAEVKFDDERGVYGMLKAVVGRALGMSYRTPDEKSADQSAGLNLDLGRFGFEDPGSSGENAPGGKAPSRFDRGRLREPRGDWSGRLSRTLYEGESLERDAAGEDPSSLLASDATADRVEPREDISEEELLWQLHDAWILTQIRSGLIIIDQQAAHERVLYEKALHALEDGFGLSQQLLFPRTIEFTASDLELLKELLPDLRSLGFDVEPFGGRSVVVRGVPADIRAGDERSVLDGIVDQYREFERVERLEGRENLARSVARKSAIKAGTRLTHAEMRSLIDQLFQCSRPYVGPGGKPTIVKLSVDELRRRFDRKR
ncbi:MAG: DNA mismatch repair endonuclease MutL [Rhodothermales bacterium]|nr:DNA mismatch repair endonuclease MutL [Rhodothermales bacterium]